MQQQRQQLALTIARSRSAPAVLSEYVYTRVPIYYSSTLLQYSTLQMNKSISKGSPAVTATAAAIMFLGYACVSTQSFVRMYIVIVVP